MVHDEAGQQLPSKESVHEWVRAYSGALFAQARQRVRKKEVAEDLVQEVFVAAWQGVESFRAESSVKTWLFGILDIKIREHFRKTLRRPETTEADINCFDDDGNWLPEWRPHPWSVEDHLLDNTAFTLVLDQCLDALPPKASSTIVATYYEQRRGPEICQDLGIPSTQYWQLLHRARLQLRRCLEDHWFAKDSDE